MRALRGRSQPRGLEFDYINMPTFSIASARFSLDSDFRGIPSSRKSRARKGLFFFFLPPISLRSSILVFGFWLGQIEAFITMMLESISSPHRRSQQTVITLSPTFRKLTASRDELGSWSTIYQRHRFLIMSMTLLACLCTIYLYFAVTIGDGGKSDLCSGLTQEEEALCRYRLVKDSTS